MPGEGSLLRPIELDSDEDKQVHKRRTRTRAAPKLPNPVYRASVKDLADAKANSKNPTAADVDAAIMLRIKKCLDRANHPTTPEAEAKAALHMASRLMGQYNVTQSDVLAHAAPESHQQYAGQSTVSIVRTDGDTSKSVRQQTYVNQLSWAMNEFFNCKFYTTARKWSVDVTFYGIAENTAAAAMAFEMAYNLIAEWARPYKGVGSKNSYCHGVCDQLYRDARKEKKQEEELAKMAELEGVKNQDREDEAERKAKLARLEGPVHDEVREESLASSPESAAKSEDDDGDVDDKDEDDNDGIGGSFDTDSDEDMGDFLEPTFEVSEDNVIDLTNDIDDEIDNLVKREPVSSEEELSDHEPRPTNIKGDPAQIKEENKIEPELPSNEKVKSEPSKNELEVGWRSHSQLVLFRDTASKIAEDYLKEKNMKLRKGRKRNKEIRDRSAYQQGEKDSAKIDVRRKRIKEE